MCGSRFLRSREAFRYSSEEADGGSGGDKAFQELGEAAGHGVDISPIVAARRSFEEVNRRV